MRHKNVDWSLPTDCENWTQVSVAVLMDIRDELRALNKIISCPNFIAIPCKLDEMRWRLADIKRNTTKRRRKKKAVKP